MLFHERFNGTRGVNFYTIAHRSFSALCSVFIGLPIVLSSILGEEIGVAVRLSVYAFCFVLICVMDVLIMRIWISESSLREEFGDGNDPPFKGAVLLSRAFMFVLCVVPIAFIFVV